MHDVDRTQLEAADSGEFELDSGEFEFEHDYEASSGMEGEGLLNEMDEMELAAEFLEVQDEAELDQFIGKLIGRVAKGAGKFFRSPLGQKLGGLLKGAAKKLLPVAGKALGAAFGGPLGAAVGGKLAAGAGDLLGLELEGLSPEDREFEAARQYVRFATAAVAQAAAAPASQPPESVAQNAATDAARAHAPGLVKPRPGAGGAVRYGSGRRTGRWIRRGNRIVLLGV
jgi:hypothetical protein